jgi:hypothetical protein
LKHITQRSNNHGTSSTHPLHRPTHRQYGRFQRVQKSAHDSCYYAYAACETAETGADISAEYALWFAAGNVRTVKEKSD